ncbi:ribosomal protein L15 [Myriangium duriaei CBS 260.36]|uniref:Ribosomal protein L15 n=1 Tax=Myriangium duriaei CBS 260.36 TaxID=1168546 RepID=A0A9P4IW81_9PEZI|nr:ribosomal protein L15 [Myriangium duriaei CBS 260.36]
MPPLPRLLRPSWLSASSNPHTSTSAILTPVLTYFQQCRHASILSSLSDVPAAYNKRIRRGRGPASGKGKQAGRGAKGQKKRGKVAPGFEGGQTPISVVHGPRGFINVHTQEMTPLNLSRVQRWIADGRLDASKPISILELLRSGCISGVKDGIKLLAKSDLETGAFATPIQIVVSRASAAAIDAVEKAGGQVVTRYYSASSLGRVRRGEVHPFYSLQSRALGPIGTAAVADVEGGTTDAVALEEGKRSEMEKYRYRLADATSRRDIEYYQDGARRGYLSHLVPEGHGPNLFFRGQGTAAGKKKTARKGQAKADNLMW